MPTMELGIDIGDFYMRNVPPNPSNYALHTAMSTRAMGRLAMPTATDW